MKQLIIITVATVLLFSCKKDIEQQIPDTPSANQQFFDNIQRQLKDSLSASDYNNINFSLVLKSKDAQHNYYYVRIGLVDKSLATDFILLQTDSLGQVLGGKLIHMDKQKMNNTKRKKFNGQFLISTLNRQHMNTLEVTNGKWNPKSGAIAMAPAPEEGEGEEPVGEQILPDVVVTSYVDGSAEIDWYWYDGLYSGGGSSGNNSSGEYTYGPASGGGVAQKEDPVKSDSTIIIKMELNDDATITVENYIKCFSSIPDENATYRITILSDIPVNGDPSKMFDWSTTSTGHSFVQLYKSGGGQSIQQNFGFYPEYGWKAPTNISVDSKIADNAGHEYNASLTLTVNSSQFQAALNKIQAVSAYDYNITTWNCTDFALSIFNAACSLPLTIPQFIVPNSPNPIPATFTYSNTPQGLYEQIQMLEATNNTLYGAAEIPGVCGYAGASHGSCN